MRRGQGLHAQTREKGAQFQRSRRARAGHSGSVRASPVAPPWSPAACAAGSAVGLAVSLVVPLHHKLVAVVVAVPAAGCAIIAFGVVAYFLDDGDLKFVLGWLRRAMAKLRS